MKKFNLILMLCLFSLMSHAQELTIPTYTQYLADNPFILSPAYAGIGENIKIRANGLTQWVGIKDAPDNQSLAADMRIGKRSGVGAFIYNDKNGYTNQSGAKVSFAHHLTLDYDNDSFLSFGISYNVNTFRIDVNEFNGPDASVTDDRKTINHNFDVSALYRLKEFYISLNINNVVNKDLKIFDTNEPARLRNYQVYAGYIFRKSRNSEFEIEPSTYIQYYESDGRSTTDLNVKFRYKTPYSYYWAGLSYRFLNDQVLKPLNVGPMAGVKINNLYFAYSYQVTVNDFFGYNTGTHMITLGWDIFQGPGECKCTM
ncbi:PorP/SprF family type IX secretion system membrane protein [Formosa haliotis]|uniref:PorP/SprF family type IX secretion system membrane protein n=1 Tax=Formosa haliotis TaxID=1555194 RepID=UPI000825A68A|nr:type IX secretion system membrane protein PorP/SprF [Formosa haliotis]